MCCLEESLVCEVVVVPYAVDAVTVMHVLLFLSTELVSLCTLDFKQLLLLFVACVCAVRV